jgi:hypothetical protein
MLCCAPPRASRRVSAGWYTTQDGWMRRGCSCAGWGAVVRRLRGDARFLLKVSSHTHLDQSLRSQRIVVPLARAVLAFLPPQQSAGVRSVSKWSCLSVAGGSPPLRYPAGRVGTPGQPSQPPSRGGPSSGHRSLHAAACLRCLSHPCPRERATILLLTGTYTMMTTGTLSAPIRS